METITQWLETLPEPYRTEALENFDPTHIVDPHELDIAKSSLSNAVLFGFDWSETRQGISYWDSFHSELMIKEFKTK